MGTRLRELVIMGVDSTDQCPDCGQILEIGDWPFPCKGRGHILGSFYRSDAQIHSSEKVVVYENPATGDMRVPGRGDRPIHPKLAAAGYVRKTLDTISDVHALEKKNGLIHEPGNFSDSTSHGLKATGAR